MGWWQNLFHTMGNQIALFRITDLIDIAIVSYIVYIALKFIRDTKTVQLLKGVALVIILTQVSYAAKLNTIYYILSNFLQLGIITLLIVFQPELRRALEHAGRRATGSLFVQHNDYGVEIRQTISEISKAAQNMSNTQTGALIVIEKTDNVDDLISSGVALGAKVTGELLENIFVPDTPLHDGAVVIRNLKIELASCVLPLSQNPNIKTSYGTRHRAGIGISEESDAVAVIVSEETGRISVAYKGELTTGYNEESLANKISELVSVEVDDNEGGKPKFRLSEIAKRRSGR